MEAAIYLYATGVYFAAGVAMTIVVWVIPYGREPSWTTVVAWPVHLVDGLIAFGKWLVG